MLTNKIMKMKEDIISILEAGRIARLEPEMLVDNIFSKVVDRDILVMEGTRERPLYIDEMAIIVERALKQAEFEGGFVVLPSGEKIKMKEKTFTSIKGINENRNGRCKINERLYDRISSNIKVSFNCCNTSYGGFAINLSENGMFIRTEEISFPLDMKFELSISLQKEILHVPVEVSRLMKSHHHYNGLGVKLFNPPQEYFDYIGNLN